MPSSSLSSAISTPPSSSSSSSNTLPFSSSTVSAVMYNIPVESTKGSLVPYLPHDDAVAAGLGAEEGGIDAAETQQVADLLNEELGRLLKMPPHQFWQTVTTCDSVEASLDSYLQYRRRWYDVCNNEHGKPLAGVIVGEQELSRRVFMVLYRMSLSSESGSLPAENVYQKRIFNIPRLLDICAIYGHDNAGLTQQLVSNAFTINERLVDDLANIVPIISNTVQTLQQRCSSIMLMQSPTSDAVEKVQQELLQVLDYLIDTVASLHAFVDAYPHGALVLVLGTNPSGINNQILSTLATMHDVLAPTVSRSFSYWMGSLSGESTMRTRSKRLRFRLLELVWRLLCSSYLMEDNVANSKDSTIRNLEEVYICDGQARGERLVQSLSRMVEETYQYLSDEEFVNNGQLIRNVDRKHGILERVHQLQRKGLISLDSVQYDYMKALIADARALTPSSSAAMQSVTQTTAGLSEADVLNESKISHIKDILPDYGSGFIAACLEAYDKNPEEVIQRILEGTLHPALQCLDPSLETKPATPNVSVPVKDKGKGKAVEAASARKGSSIGLTGAEQHQASSSAGWHGDPPPRLSSSTLASSSLFENGDGFFPPRADGQPAKDTGGRYVRKDKGEENVSTLLNERDRDDVFRTAAYAAQYEDEYDDSFDDLGTHIADGVEETEILVDYVRLKMPLQNEGGSQNANKNGGRFDGGERGGWGWSSNGGSTPANARGTPSRESGSKVLESQRLGQSQPSRGRGRGRRDEPRGQFFVKDGKIYSYRVSGSVTVSSLEDAEALKRVEKETIYGLREGGNVPVSNVQVADEKDVMGATSHVNPLSMHGDPLGRGRGAYGPGRGHGPGRGDHSVRGGAAHGRGRGLPRKEHDHHHRKDRAMKKHFAGLGGM